MKKIKYIVCAALLAFTATSMADWRPASNGYLPRGAWQVGYEEDGTPLYLCRAYYRGLHPGKIRRGFNGCNISFAGKELEISNYFVFVNRPTSSPIGARVIIDRDSDN